MKIHTILIIVLILYPLLTPFEPHSIALHKVPEGSRSNRSLKSVVSTSTYTNVEVEQEILQSLHTLGGSSGSHLTSGWEEESAIAEGDWHIPWYYLYPYLVYNLRGDGKWIIITGREAYGGYFGFYWDVSKKRWVYDESLTKGLSAHGWEEAPALAYNVRGDGKWILIGHAGSKFYGYYWNGSYWVEDPSIVAGLPEIYGEIKHCFIENLTGDGKWTMISGTDEGPLRAFYWDPAQKRWIEDPSRVKGIPDIGEHTCVTAAFNFRGDNRWVLIVTRYSMATPRGFYWNGSQWIEDPSIVVGLPCENILKPTIGYNVFGDGKWVMFMGYPRQGSILAYVYNTVDTSKIPPQKDISVVDVKATTARINFSYPYTWSHRIKYSMNPDMSNALWSTWVHDEDHVHIVLKYLKPDTTYYFQVYTYVPWNTSYYVASSIMSFHTLQSQSYFYLTPGQSIQDALEMLPPEGGVIELASGTFYVDKPIRIWMDNVTIRGRGMNETIITVSGSFEGHIIQIGKADDLYYRGNWIYTHKDLTFWFNYPRVPFNASILTRNIHISDLTLDGKNTNGGIYGVELWDSTFTRIRTRDTTGAITIGPCINVLIGNCISEHDRIAYWFTLLSRSCYVKNCTVVNAYGWVPSIHTNGATRTEFKEVPPYPPPEISYNKIYNSIDGIHVYSTSHIIVKRNIIDGCRRIGLLVSISYNCTILENIVRNNHDYGICYCEAEGCTFMRNIVYNNGGNGFELRDRFEKSRTGMVVNNVFWNNGGDGIYNPYGEQKIVVKNNIIGMNKGYGINGPFETIAYNNIWNNSMGSYNRATPGIGNIHEDPLFADPGGGDFHLKSEYGRWDPELGKWVYDSVTSPCIDAGDPGDDYSNEPEPNGGRINMGAYGNTPEASRSPGLEVQRVELEKGWNLISVVVKSKTPYKASDLAEDLGTNCKLVAKWDSNSQKYTTYIPGFSPEEYNFEIRPEYGYFVYLDTSTLVELSGVVVRVDTIELKKGWNLVGWDRDEITAKEIAQSIGGECKLLAKWISGEQKYTTYIPGFSPEEYNFKVKRGEAIFIYMEKEKTWTRP